MSVYFAHFPLTAPQVTSFGESELAPSFAVFRVTVAGSGARSKIVRSSPNLTSLVISTYLVPGPRDGRFGAAYSKGVDVSNPRLSLTQRRTSTPSEDTNASGASRSVRSRSHLCPTRSPCFSNRPNGTRLP